MVIGNQGENFSAGANLMLLLFEIQDENWDEIEGTVKMFQDALMAVKYFEKPVVAAPSGLTLGGDVRSVSLRPGSGLPQKPTWASLNWVWV